MGLGLPPSSSLRAGPILKVERAFSGSLLEVSLLACDVAVTPESQCQHPRLLFPSRFVEHGGQAGMSVPQASVLACCLLGLWARAPPFSAVLPGVYGGD